jgi:hypothetical protein
VAATCKRCVSDEDFAQASLFFIEHKRDLHPAFTTVDTLNILSSYLTQGHLLQTVDSDNRVIGVMAYYQGTPEESFENKQIAFADMAIFDKASRGTRLFVKGLRFWLSEVQKEHPEVEEMRLAALAENRYTCRLYGKFTETSYPREGTVGPEVVFCVKVNRLETILKKFDRL